MAELPPTPEPSRRMAGDPTQRLILLLAVAAALFTAGIFLPMLTITKFIVASHSFSVVSGLLELFENGQYVLFLVVLGFSVVLPVLKIGMLFLVLVNHPDRPGKRARYLHLMHEYGRWAMLDVLVVAVLIVTVKLGAIASVQVHYGLYVFGAAVLLIMLITNSVVRLMNRVEP